MIRVYRVITTKHEMKVSAVCNACHAVELATRAFNCPDRAIKSVEYKNIGEMHFRYLYRNNVNGVFETSKLNEQW